MKHPRTLAAAILLAASAPLAAAGRIPLHVERPAEGAPLTFGIPFPKGALDYKFDWWLFNQRWVPWYGVFDYGDGKLYFNNEKWDVWSQNEPAEDFELWLQFMRTGDARYFDVAQAFSRHAMDVDNVSWPATHRRRTRGEPIA